MQRQEGLDGGHLEHGIVDVAEEGILADVGAALATLLEVVPAI